MCTDFLKNKINFDTIRYEVTNKLRMATNIKKIKLNDKNLIPLERVERRIFLIRGEKVMFDSDLAELYQVETKNLNKAVKRNLDRFPKDFTFQLTKEETENWNSRFQNGTMDMRFQFGTAGVRSQFATASRRNIRFSPYVFTEHGVAMLSSVLRSKRAVQMNILIIRAFVKLREMIASNKDLANRMEKVETVQKKHTSVIEFLAGEINKMKKFPEPPRNPMGFVPK